MDKDKIELDVRRAISEEVGKYREFLQNQFKLMTWGISIVFVAGAIVFNFIVGKRIEDSEKHLSMEVDAKVVEYRLVEKFKENLNEHIKVAVDNVVDSDYTQQRIGEKLNSSVETLTAQKENELQDQVNSLVQSQVQELTRLNSAELLAKASIPKGAILAFNRINCPNGWQAFEAANGRFLVGTGTTLGLKTKNLLEVGGEDEHTLTID